MNEVRIYTADSLLTELKAQNPGFALEWDQIALGQNVRLAIVQARANAGLTQAQLAEKLGVKQSVVARYEKGNYDVRLSTLQRIVNATGQPITLTVEPTAPVEARPEQVEVEQKMKKAG